MKVAVILPSLANKAPIIVARDIVNALAKNGFQVTVFYLREINGCSFCCECKRLTLFSFFDLFDFDIIHSHMFRPDVISMIVKLLSKRSRVHVSTIHSIYRADLKNSYSTFISFFAASVWRLAWKVIGTLVVLNKFSKKFYESEIGVSDITVIYNGRSLPTPNKIQDEDFNKINILRSKFKILGACAGVSKIKGFDQVITALPDMPDYCFLLVGDGPELIRLLELANSFGVSDRFFCLGYKPNAIDYLPFFDVFVMSSRAEGMPLALIEAVASHVPVISSNISQISEIFTEDEVSFFELDCKSSFIQAIAKIEQSSESYVCNSYKRYLKFYTSDAMGSNYVSLFIDKAGFNDHPKD